MKAYSDFEREFLGSGHGREGPNLSILRELTVDERRMAEEKLLSVITKDDIFNIEALGIIGTQRSVERLRTFTISGSGRVRAEAALALWRIVKDREVIDILIELSKKRFFFNCSLTRLAAVQALANIDDPASTSQLLRLLNDTDEIIRDTALPALADRFGVESNLGENSGHKPGEYSTSKVGGYNKRRKSNDDMRNAVISFVKNKIKK